jgi:hypothetical protein
MDAKHWVTTIAGAAANGAGAVAVTYFATNGAPTTLQSLGSFAVFALGAALIGVGHLLMGVQHGVKLAMAGSTPSITEPATPNALRGA